MARRKKKRPTYRVLKPITHLGDGQNYGPGAEVRLDHVSEEGLRLLLDGGVVEVVEEEQEQTQKDQKQEVKDGTDE
jgi:hypothetical protein